MNIFEEEERLLEKEIDNANNQEFEETNDEIIVQGSRQWFKLRLGLFTGSKMPNLMTKGRGVEFGETAIKVIKQVMLERDLSESGIELYVTELMRAEFRQTEWGTKYEPLARERYCEKTGYNVDLTGFHIPDFQPNMGSSSDGLIVEENGIIEIKCPYDVLVHASNCDLSKIDRSHNYYAQIQNNIFINQVNFCDFISFDPRRKSKSLHIVRVERDGDFIEELVNRVNLAERAIYFSIKYNMPIPEALNLAANTNDD